MTAACRPMQPVDRQFVLSGWSSSYRVSDHAGLISMSRWATVMHREVAAILDHPTTRTLVAEEPGEVDDKGQPFLYGFLVWCELSGAIAGLPPQGLPYVYYVFVKTAFRRGRERLGLERGIAAQLFAAAGINPRAPFMYACSTDMLGAMARKIPLAEFNALPARFLT